MTNTELVRQLNTASIQCDEMRLRDFGYLMKTAAEKIDELLDSVETLDNLTDMLMECVPQWIPVTERLPEEYKDVLCYYEYFRYGDYNCMFRTIDRGYYGNGIWGGEAGQGHKNKVLAWMPLPEPPKEE